MQITKKNLSDTKVKLTLTADAEILAHTKQAVLRQLGKEVKVQGFRQGKAPIAMLEKQLEPARLQSEFLDHAINEMYGSALDQEKLRPVQRPDVKITKFVPYETLEVEVEVEVIGQVKLGDYKKIKLAKETATITAKDVDEVIASLQTREATRTEVTRAAKNGDQVTIDFSGVDAKTKEPIAGADGKAFPLTLGTNTFIPGFEPELVGLKPGQEKTFTLTFPKDYGVSALQNRKVTFTVTATKVDELQEPKLDDAFAAKIGPFKTVADLKADIKQELQARQQQDANQKYADELITKITQKSQVAIPDALLEEQVDRLEKDQRQNVLYRGQTWQEYLDSEGLTDKTYRDKQKPAAELRVKAGLVLSAIAEAEQIDITQQELAAYMQAIKARYPDPKMQAELAKPEAQREMASRLLTEKTIAKLTEYAGSK